MKLLTSDNYAPDIVGEKCAGYINRTIAIKQEAQTIDILTPPPLPESRQECSADPDKLNAAHAYYQQLLSSYPVDDHAITALNNCIASTQFLSSAHQATLSSLIPLEVIAKHAERSSSRPSSPGPDSLTHGVISFAVVCHSTSP